MTAKLLKDAMERVETWPEEAQEELAAIADHRALDDRFSAFRPFGNALFDCAQSPPKAI